jgi:dTDP-4-dehydrorhamnose 3,5-epimerase
MIFTPLGLRGAYLVDLEPRQDERGFFARTWSRSEFEEHGLNPRIEQCSVSLNHRRGTLRGMHYQMAPHEEGKLVRCIAGAIHDVIIDLRPSSATFARWEAVELTAANRRMLYVPEGFAHGFLTLAKDTEVFYQMSEAYHPESAGGVRWDDPAFAIIWPEPVLVISDRDASYPDYEPVGVDIVSPR